MDATGCWAAEAFGGDGGSTTTLADANGLLGVANVSVTDDDHEGVRVCDVLRGMWGRAWPALFAWRNE